MLYVAHTALGDDLFEHFILVLERFNAVVSTCVTPLVAGLAYSTGYDAFCTFIFLMPDQFLA